MVDFLGEEVSNQTFAYLIWAALAQQEWEDTWMHVWCFCLPLSLTAIHEDILFPVVTMDVTIQKNIIFSHHSVIRDNIDVFIKSVCFSSTSETSLRQYITLKLMCNRKSNKSTQVPYSEF